MFRRPCLLLALSCLLAASPVLARVPSTPAGTSTEQAALQARKVASSAYVVDRPLDQPEPFRNGTWGLQASDFSLLYDEALLRKARLPERAADLKAAADGGDGVALFLLGLSDVYHGDKLKGREEILRAEAKGVLRASVMMTAQRLLEAKNEEEYAMHRYQLKAKVGSDSAYAAYTYARVVIGEMSSAGQSPNEHYDAKDAMGALQFSAAAGFAPAQQVLAAILFNKASRDPANKTALREAHDWLDKAAAQGEPYALKMAKERPRPADLGK